MADCSKSAMVWYLHEFSGVWNAVQQDLLPLVQRVILL